MDFGWRVAPAPRQVGFRVKLVESRLEAVWRRPSDARKSKARGKPWDAVVIFKALMLCARYNLSDEQFAC